MTNLATVKENVVAIECMEDASKQEILEAISLLAETVQGVSEKTDQMFSDVKMLKSQMVTKNYLDDKLADLRADLIVMARKTNTKISLLIEGLVTDGSLRREIADQLLAMEPFARA